MSYTLYISGLNTKSARGRHLIEFGASMNRFYSQLTLQRLGFITAFTFTNFVIILTHEHNVT